VEFFYETVQNLLCSCLLSKNVKIKIYKPVALYGCETWSLTLREEHRLRMFDNGIISRIFRPKWEEVVGGWRTLHNEKLHKLYASAYIIGVT
jgi:hypothetical protein